MQPIHILGTLFHKDGDFQAFERILEEALAHVPGMWLLSYGLMPNHWHLMVWPKKDGELSDYVRWLSVTHTQRWHAHHRTAGTGPLYQGQPVHRHYGKMGKSLKNSVSPDEIYQAYGADTLRMYEMAMGPLDVDRPWQPDDIVGVYRFLQRLWRNIVNEETAATLRRTGAPCVEKPFRISQLLDVVRRVLGTPQ